MDQHFYNGFIKRAQHYGLSAVEADRLVKIAGRAAFRRIEEQLKNSTPEQQEQILNNIHKSTTAHAARSGNQDYIDYVADNKPRRTLKDITPIGLYSQIHPNEVFPMSSHNNYRVPETGFAGPSSHPFNGGMLTMYDTAHNFTAPPVFTGHLSLSSPERIKYWGGWQFPTPGFEDFKDNRTGVDRMSGDLSAWHAYTQNPQNYAERADYGPRDFLKENPDHKRWSHYQRQRYPMFASLGAPHPTELFGPNSWNGGWTDPGTPNYTPGPFHVQNPLYETVVTKNHTRYGKLIPERIFQTVGEGGKSLSEFALPMDGSKVYKGFPSTNIKPIGERSGQIYPTTYAMNRNNMLHLDPAGGSEIHPQVTFLSGDPRVSAGYANPVDRAPASHQSPQWKEVDPALYVKALKEDNSRSRNALRYVYHGDPHNEIIAPQVSRNVTNPGSLGKIKGALKNAKGGLLGLGVTSAVNLISQNLANKFYNKTPQQKFDPLDQIK